MCREVSKSRHSEALFCVLNSWLRCVFSGWCWENFQPLCASISLEMKKIIPICVIIISIEWISVSRVFRTASDKWQAFYKGLFWVQILLFLKWWLTWSFLLHPGSSPEILIPTNFWVLLLLAVLLWITYLHHGSENKALSCLANSIVWVQQIEEKIRSR